MFLGLCLFKVHKKTHGAQAHNCLQAANLLAWQYKMTLKRLDCRLLMALLTNYQACSSTDRCQEKPESSMLDEITIVSITLGRLSRRCSQLGWEWWACCLLSSACNMRKQKVCAILLCNLMHRRIIQSTSVSACRPSTSTLQRMLNSHQSAYGETYESCLPFQISWSCSWQSEAGTSKLQCNCRNVLTMRTCRLGCHCNAGQNVPLAASWQE